MGIARGLCFTTLQKWLSNQISYHWIFPTHICSPSLPRTFTFDTPASISSPLCSLAKVYFVIFLYFITSLNIVIVISIIPFTFTHILCIRYLTPTFTYHHITQETLWKPHADMESLCVILLTNIFTTESLGQAILMPTHTPFYSPVVPTNYLFRSLQGVSTFFNVTVHSFSNLYPTSLLTHEFRTVHSKPLYLLHQWCCQLQL